MILTGKGKEWDGKQISSGGSKENDDIDALEAQTKIHSR